MTAQTITPIQRKNLIKALELQVAENAAWGPPDPDVCGPDYDPRVVKELLSFFQDSPVLEILPFPLTLQADQYDYVSDAKDSLADSLTNAVLDIGGGDVAKAILMHTFNENWQPWMELSGVREISYQFLYDKLLPLVEIAFDTFLACEDGRPK